MIAIAELKRLDLLSLPGSVLTEVLSQILADKGMGESLLPSLATQPAPLLAALIGHHLLRQEPTAALAAHLHEALAHLPPLPAPRYRGSRPENREIGASIWESALPASATSLRAHTWKGAAGLYCSPLRLLDPALRATPILIVGAGAAGLLTARALANVGFTHVTVLEQAATAGGIWSRQALQQAGRANPFALRFEQFCLPAAPGPGQEVARFLRQLTDAHPVPFPPIIRGRVGTIEPGDLAHRVCYRDALGEEQQRSAPIVVNAIGVGRPLAPRREGKMETDVGERQAGRRWQHPLLAGEVAGRHFVFVGLSNATLAMVSQLQAYQRAGIQTHYRVVTHYPTASLYEPTRSIEHGGQTYHLYRDLPGWFLLRVAGDLLEVGQALEQARDQGHILPSVARWTRGEQAILATTEDGQTHALPCNDLYTLIGYGPPAPVLERMGCTLNNPYLGAVDQDYDGEIQHCPDQVGRARVWPGYFACGLRNSFNPNETLLPGLLFRLPDLVAGVVLRAMEWQVREGGASH